MMVAPRWPDSASREFARPDDPGARPPASRQCRRTTLRPSIGILMMMLCWSLSTSQPADARVFRGTVIRVHDNDTVLVQTTERKFAVRLAAIDAPELAQSFGVQSGNHLRARLLNREVVIVWSKHDKYFRRVGQILLNGEDSMNLSQLPKDGGFPERIAAVNAALLEHFAFLENASQDDALGAISEDELQLLSELWEEAPEDSDRFRYLVDAVSQLGQACVYGRTSFPNASELAELGQTLRQLKREHALVLMDELKKRTAVLESASVRRDWLEFLDED